MADKSPFYHSTIKRYVAIFGSVFNELSIINDKGEQQLVPLFYAPREKFLVLRQENKDKHQLNVAMPYPRMAFEMTGISYAPQRHTNKFNRIVEKNSNKWQWNRVPYDFNFQLYIYTKQQETGLKIIEQIAPIFTPTLNVTINEIDTYHLNNDIAIELDSVQQDMDYQGGFESQRTLSWTLGFTVKGWLYARDNINVHIKEVIAKLSNKDLDEIFARYTKENAPEIKQVDYSQRG